MSLSFVLYVVFVVVIVVVVVVVVVVVAVVVVVVVVVVEACQALSRGDRGERASASTQNAPHGLKSTPGKTLPMAFKSAPGSPGMPWIARVALLKPSGAIRGDAECQGSPGKAMGSDSGRC